MKAKKGFVMRCIVDEYIIMPTDDNIDRFEGTVILNSVSAFIWEKLHQDTTREMILEALLDEFDVTPQLAGSSLDDVLQRFMEYGMIEL